jgi:peroxin-6
LGASGKGKGKAPVSNHASKNSVDIAEGGFGDAAQDDDLYS